MNEEASTLTGEMDLRKQSWHDQQLEVAHSLLPGKKRWNMMQTTLLEIISTVEKKFDKISEAFKNIGNRDSLQQQRRQHKKMYSSPLSPERNLHDRLHAWNQNTDQPSRFNQRSSWRHGKCL